MLIKKFNVKIYILMCLCIMYLFITDMSAAFELYLPLNKYMIIIVFFLTIFGIINELNIRKIKNTKLVRILISFLVLIICTSLVFMIQNEFSVKYSILQLVSSILWILIMFYSYIISKNNPEVIKYLKKMIYVLPIFLLLYIEIKEFSNNRGIPLISCIYYLVFLLPVLFVHENKKIKLIGCIIIVYALLLSQKRTGLLAMISFFAVYFFVFLKIRFKNVKVSKEFFKTFIIILVLVLIIGGIVLKESNIKIIEKMRRISTDGGSGRIEIWVNLFHKFGDNNIFEFVFGNGFNAVYYELGMEKSAHNDFFEILYDYGIVGIILYVMLLKHLIKKGQALIKKEKEIAATYLASIVMVLVFSITSHLVIYPTYFFFMCILWGNIMGIMEGEENVQN